MSIQLSDHKRDDQINKMVWSDHLGKLIWFDRKFCSRSIKFDLNKEFGLSLRN